jgi:hypothetical protein
MASSIRMIQQPVATASAAAGAGGSTAECDTALGDIASASAIHPQSITVTKTLEIVPATPPSAATSRIHHMGGQSFVESAGVAHAPSRFGSDMNHLKLPAIPNISTITLAEPVNGANHQPPSRPKTAPGPTQDSYDRPVQPKLPPFMQSRRWARMCEPPRPKTSSHVRAVSEEERPMTLREASFEQQRAAWRHAVPAFTEETIKENEPVIDDQGLCRTVSLPTWQLIRVARGIRGRSEPSNNLLHKFAPQRTRKSSIHSRRQSVDRPRARTSRSAQIGRKRAMPDLRKQASTSKRETSNHVVNLDIISHRSAIGRAASPVPSLHDPEKAKRFSEECEALLTNKDFEKDFMSTSTGPSHAASSNLVPQNGFKGSKFSTAGSEAYVLDSSTQASDRVWENQTSMVAAPQPPIRTSSKGGARLATMVQITKPVCMPILSGFKDGSLIAPDDASVQVPPQLASTRPRVSRIPCRVASVTSTASEATRSPRPAKSSDTLTLIEAQIRTTPRPGHSESSTKKVAQTAVHGKQLSPSGNPPERPLPDLPADSGSVLTKTPPRPVDISCSGLGNPARTLPSKDILLMAESEKAQPQSPRRHKAPVLSLRDHPSEVSISQAVEEQTLATPTSAYSQSSIISDATGKHRFARHDKTRFRADRIKELRRRIKADLERQNRISEERDDDELAKQATLAVENSSVQGAPEPEIKAQPSLDQLDQFPQVPASRPASRASHHSGPSRRADSRTRGHVRQCSKSSSRLSYRSTAPRPPNRQILGTSQIRVLVDTDPVTGHFRAGAMTPEQGSVHDYRSAEGSPRKPTFKGVRSTTLPNRIDENKQMNISAPRSTTSMRSIRSHASAISARHSVAGSHHSKRRPSADTATNSMIDSSDDENLLLTVSKGGKRRLRRRWNSNDIRTVQGLYEDLGQYYETLIRQEQELQKQREEIQMMVRVMAPMSRAHGLRTATFPAERHEFVDAGVNLDDVRSTRAPSAASTTRPVAWSHAPSIASGASPACGAPPAGAEKRASKSSSKAKLDAASKALDEAIKERPVSDLSTASGTTDVSRGSRSSRDNSAAEGSMTDPFEYDVGPLKAIAAVVTKGANHGLAIHGHKSSLTLSLAPSQGSRPQSRNSGDVLSSMARSPAPLHKPPPVAKVIPRGTLSEEDEADRESVLLRSAVPNLGVELGKDMFRSPSGLSGHSRASEHRLSVNHVFTRTEEMDRMLSVISALD